MISVSGKEWEEINVNKLLIEKIKSEQNISQLIAKLVVSRNFDETEIYSIKNDVDLLNPFLNNSDYNECFRTLDEVVGNNGKIQIIGDYDVDGIVSTSLFIKFFQFIKYPYTFYIPDRVQDGYGASLKLVKKLIYNKPDLVIMLDCGSNSHDAIKHLNKNNIKTIIIDHHEIFKPYPKTKNIINPKKECIYSNFDYFCSATLTYFFIDYFFKKKFIKNNFEKNLIYVLLATVADVMPLRKFNRVIAKKILNDFDITKNFIFNEIYKINNKKNNLNISDLGFLIAPLFNAAGRIDKADKVVNLLTTSDNDEKNKIILDLHKFNNKRKKIEEIILKKIDLDKINKIKENIIILLIENINEGLIGIIASKLKGYFNKPCIIFTNSGSNYKGSARSTEDFNVGKYIKLGIDNEILLSGGGHSLAAGLTIKKEKFKTFVKFINEQVILKKKENRTIKYLSKIDLSAVNLNFCKEFDLLEPYGPFNSKPFFLIENLKIIKSSILKNKYVNCLVSSSSGKTINAISFSLIESEISKILLNYKYKVNIIAEINLNLWNNRKSLQLNIQDIIL
jgi:single-stranded-DNA-specific exonuclease